MPHIAPKSCETGSKRQPLFYQLNSDTAGPAENKLLKLRFQVQVELNLKLLNIKNFFNSLEEES